jgi:hypothetical protein
VPAGWGCSVPGVICAVHSGQRAAATGMLIVHSGQSLVVAAWFRSKSFSRRLTGPTTPARVTRENLVTPGLSPRPPKRASPRS